MSAAASAPKRPDRPIVLVGLMGAGKTTVGRRLAQRLGLPFVDADEEIEAAAGMSISEIFEMFGEPYFRDGERRVIARLIDGSPKVIATGGGAFMNDKTRALILDKATAVWLEADINTLVDRAERLPPRPQAAAAPPGLCSRTRIRARCSPSSPECATQSMRWPPSMSAASLPRTTRR